MNAWILECSGLHSIGVAGEMGNACEPQDSSPCKMNLIQSNPDTLSLHVCCTRNICGMLADPPSPIEYGDIYSGVQAIVSLGSTSDQEGHSMQMECDTYSGLWSGLWLTVLCCIRKVIPLLIPLLIQVRMDLYIVQGLNRLPRSHCILGFTLSLHTLLLRPTVRTVQKVREGPSGAGELGQPFPLSVLYHAWSLCA